MADLKEAAKRAASRRQEKDKRDLILALDCWDGQVYRIGPLILKPPTMLSLLILEELGGLEALLAAKVSLSAVLRVLVVVELTSGDEDKLSGLTTEERKATIEARIREIANQIPLHEAPKFIEQALGVIGHMLTPPEEARGKGGDSVPFPTPK